MNEEAKMVKITIDGQEVEIEEGKTVLDAANKLGIRIPTLCYNPLVEPYAACRICSVERIIGKRSRIVTACNYPVTEGVVINTGSETVREIRRMILELLMSRCSPDIPILRELAEEYGIERSRFGEGTDKCILCGCCVRVCDEIVGACAIGFGGRGVERQVMPPYGEESEACIACGACAVVCPTDAVEIKDLYGREIIHRELALGPPKAVTVPTLQAVPNVPVINPDYCIHFRTDNCGHCQKACEPDAIDYEREDEVVEVDAGAIIVATGFDQFNPAEIHQYGYGQLANVLTALEFERLNCAAGPTGGRILMENGKEPERVALVHCVGSRDKNYNEYCSRVCCMYALKYAHLIKEKTGAEVFDFYIDLRCFGKGYEEFYHRLLEEGVRFVRGKVGEVTDFALYESEKGKLVVRAEDTLIGQIRRVPVDMVVLCPALKSREDAKAVSRIFSCSLTADGFFKEKHPKLDPVATDTEGVFIAGCCQGPKDIPDTVAQGAAAASAVLSLISRGQVELEPTTASIDEEKCSGCKICNLLCPYDAISFDEEKEVSVVDNTLCKGCGTCVAACPRAAITGRQFSDQQLIAELEGILK